MPSFEALHIPSPYDTALERLGWSPEDPALREIAPTVARGHNLIAVTPPAPVYATPAMASILGRLSEGRRALLLCPPAQVDEWGGLVHRLSKDTPLRVQVAHGTARAMRHLLSGTVDLLVAGPETAFELVGRSALKMDSINSLFLAWPESWLDEDRITPLMQDLPKDSQRVIFTTEPERAGAMSERYARRALTLTLPGMDQPAGGSVRRVGVSWARRVPALTDLLELLDPASLVIWTVDQSSHPAIAETVALNRPEVRVVTGDVPRAATIVAFDLPTPARLRQLSEASQEVALLVVAGTEGYVNRIAGSSRPLLLPGPLDSAKSAEATQLAGIVRVIESGQAQRALLRLAPLFERHDPAVVAAALFELWSSAASAAAPPTPRTDAPATSRVYVGLGKKDGATANDFVAVLTKELRFDREKIGRIELRDGFSLIELPAQDVESVAAALNGTTVRRKRVVARVDRGPTRPPTRARRER